MYKLSAVLAMSLMVFLALFTLAPQPVKACQGLAWTGTYYFSDAAKTHVVGACSINCRQFVTGSATPTFTGGGSCSGVSGPYETYTVSTCPCRY
jgi:hypothetical protein